MDGTSNSIVLRSIGLISMPVILNSLSGKFILIPIVMIIVAVGSLLLVAQGSVFAPFIYTLF